MRIVDLSHPLGPAMPVWPGTPAPRFRALARLEQDGYRELSLSLTSHTGTHVDVPAHRLASGRPLGDIGLEGFSGRGGVVDCRSVPAGTITREHLERFWPGDRGMEFVLLWTGWSERWGREDYFTSAPWLEPRAARWLAGKGLRGLGIDGPSVDPYGSGTFAAHDLLLGADLVVVENLNNLAALPPCGFLFLCLPLPLPEGDGSPVRAAALIDPA